MLTINKTPTGSTGVQCTRGIGTINVRKVVNIITVFGDGASVVITEPGLYHVVCEALDYCEGCEFDLFLK